MPIDITTLINTGLLTMVPIALTAIGEVFTERSGVVNIGLEGIILLSGFTGVLGAEFFGSWIAGLIVGLLTGALIGLIHGLISVYGKGDQIISGVGINLFALGFVAYALEAFWKTPGTHRMPPQFEMPTFSTPFGSFSPMIIVTIIIAILVHLLLKKTVIGLRINAAGENPEAVDVAGINLQRVRLLACIFGGALAGLAGAFLSIGWMGYASKELSGGRGFIALACVVFSGLNPLLALGAALLFGFAEAISVNVAVLPGVKEVMPSYFVDMIPFILTLVIVSVAIGKKRFPKYSGIPYRRE